MKRRLIRRLLLCPWVLALSLMGAAQNDGITTDPEISEMLNSISAKRIGMTAQTMQNFFTRNSCSDTLSKGKGVTPARDYIVKRYKAIGGLNPQLDKYTHPNCTTKPTYNVITWIPGSKYPNQLVIVGGHYDSRTVDVFDTTSVAPGGNDSGGQTSVVLEIAQALAGHSFDSTIVFIDFSGEEQGLYGSESIAGRLSTYFTNPQVTAMLNTDIPGGDIFANRQKDLVQFRLYSPGLPRERNSTDKDGTTDNTSPSRGVMRYVGTWGGAYVSNFTMKPILREDRPGRGSDHSAFIDHGFPAVRIMETFECSPSPVDNSCGGPFPCGPPIEIPANCWSFTTDHQHDSFDLAKYITPSYAANIAKVMASVAASLARAPGSPLNFTATGNANDGVKVNFKPPQYGTVDHYVVAARPVTENFYHTRVTYKTIDKNRLLTAQDLGLNQGDSFFISAASVDGAGHESLFAYSEIRCDTSSCK